MFSAPLLPPPRGLEGFARGAEAFGGRRDAARRAARRRYLTKLAPRGPDAAAAQRGAAGMLPVAAARRRYLTKQAPRGPGAAAVQREVARPRV